MVETATEELRGRDRWSSRTIFISACVGAAIGLGNIWRFPYLNYKYGGGVFLIPYFIFLILLGLPLMQAELALGRLRQKGDIEAFGSIHRRCRGVGVMSVIGGVGVVTYYSVIIAWCCVYFIGSFESRFPWEKENCGSMGDEGYEDCISNPATALPSAAANTYFYDTVQRYNPNNVDKGTATIVSGPVLAALLFSWLVCYFCIWKGVKSVGVAVRVTVFLPWILLAIMIVYTATLEGSKDGVKAYIGVWDLDALKSGAVWSEAAGQIFFTLGATLSIMTAYGSFAPAKTDMFVNNTTIAALNTGTSLFAGFVVFSILGHMAHEQNKTMSNTPSLRDTMCESFTDPSGDDYLDTCDGFDCTTCSTDAWRGDQCCGFVTTEQVAKPGLALAFEVYPAVMTLVSRPWGNIFSICWFGCLFLLGIDSMFAMVEGVATVITDTEKYQHLKKQSVAAVICLFGFLVSVLFATDIGVALLDTFDHYILQYALFLTGAGEAYVVSWIWGWRETSDRCGHLCAVLLTGGYTVACVLGVAIGASLHYAVDTGVNIGIGLGIGVFIFAMSVISAFIVRTDTDDSLFKWMDIWVFAGTRNLRSTFKRDPKRWEVVIHTIFYDFPVKYVCPGLLLSLIVNTAVTDATAWDNGYGDYPDWMQSVVGSILLTAMVGSLVVFALFPGFWDRLSPPDERVVSNMMVDKNIEVQAEGGIGTGIDDDWGNSTRALVALRE